MKNPLHKRWLRELKSEFARYFVIFFLLTASIGLVSGYLVALGSTITAYNSSFETYNIEDGNFTLKDKANLALEKTLSQNGVQIYPLFYSEKSLLNGSTLRFFKKRTQVDLECLMEGSRPQQPGECCIDRMYADNNGLSVGDSITDGSSTWKITGLVALSDYSALFENNSDSMFDAIKFGVGTVCEEEFDSWPESSITWRYAWKYDITPADEQEQNDRGEDLVKLLNRETELTGFIPRYQNQAIKFTGEDMGSDRSMITVLLYIIIAIMAFVFAVTTADTIRREASSIGTLRASGYSVHELVCHYMFLPLFTVFFSALLGNILGYTVMKDVCAAMYYNSYSLPTFTTLWNTDAFVLTTVVPAIIMAVVNWVILRMRLTLSPLRFLRHDFGRSRRTRALPLPRLIPFFTRFRMRVLGQNLGSYLIMFIGILFANLLLLFGLGMPDMLVNYTQEMQQNRLCEYQYMLELPADLENDERKLESMLHMFSFISETETENEDAEKFSGYSLKTTWEEYPEEDITLYGVEPDSRYISLPDGAVYMSQAFAEKYQLQAGDTLTLKEPYEDTAYTVTVTGIYPYEGALCLFMGRAALNRMLDLDEDWYSGYFSNSEITDIDEKYIGTVVDLDALTKISRQLDASMGQLMYLVDGFAMAIFVVLIYLLSRLILEKNAHAVSLAKILGYSRWEIGRLYVLSTSLVVLFSMGATIPLVDVAIRYIWRWMLMTEMTGWIPYVLSASVYRQMFLMGVVSYAVVAVLELWKIGKMPMDAALKNGE